MYMQLSRNKRKSHFSPCIRGKIIVQYVLGLDGESLGGRFYMRKKTHMSLAHHMLTDMQDDQFFVYGRAFRLGSILPDLVPSFVTKKHQIDTTFDILEKKMRKVVEEYDGRSRLSMMRCKDMGVITHYIADYFTFPHNRIFAGTMREHIRYEKVLKYAMKDYMNRGYVGQQPIIRERLTSVDDICAFIRRCHEHYLQTMEGKHETDCLYSVEVCRQVMEAIMMLLYMRAAQMSRMVRPA